MESASTAGRICAGQGGVCSWRVTRQAPAIMSEVVALSRDAACAALSRPFNGSTPPLSRLRTAKATAASIAICRRFALRSSLCRGSVDPSTGVSSSLSLSLTLTLLICKSLQVAAKCSKSQQSAASRSKVQQSAASDLRPMVFSRRRPAAFLAALVLALRRPHFTC